MKADEPKNDGIVVELDHGEAVRETVNRLAQRGFEPTVMIFHNEAGDLEVLTRGVDLGPFLRWMVDVWVPDSHDRIAGH